MFTFTIRKKIVVSFALLVALLVAVGFVSHRSLEANKDKLAYMVKDVQPAMELSYTIVNQLDRASASLGFYLLSKEELHKKDYVANMGRIAESVRQLSEMPVVKQDPATLSLVQSVDEGLNKLQGYREQMLTLAVDELKNMPAIAYASREVNPRAQTVLQNIQQMLMAEGNEEVSAERRQLLMDIFSFRTNFASAMNELRMFMSSRSNINKTNFDTFIELADKDLAKLNGYPPDFLSFEQQPALEAASASYKEWRSAANEMMRMQGAEDWRQDAFLIRKELSPLVVQIQERLNELVKNQQAASLDSSTQLSTQVQETQNTVGGLIVLGMLSALLVAWYLSRAIIKPINSLKASAYQLAHGHLDQEIDASRKDELGSLAQSFVDMRDSIKKKIEDLRILNVTGELLTSQHDPLKVLEHALRVMQEQTNVEWGSVYLYNPERDQLEVAAYFPPRASDGEGDRRARTFRLGEGAAGSAAKQREIIYLEDTSKGDPFQTQPSDDATPRAIICVPMLDGETVFGVMNFSGEVGQVTFADSDREFAETIARMAVVSFKNIQMLQVIEEQNRTLEQKVEERTAQLKQKTNDINNMLQNMHQGIFTILPGRTIHPEYSAYLARILENEQIANADVMDLLFSDSDLGPNAISQVSAALDAILGEDEMMFDFNRHCLVGEFRKTMADGRVKILELDWDPILSESGSIDKLMVTVRDVTELRGLQAEAEKQKWELQVIGQILAVTPDKFQGFVRDAYRFADENAQIINETDAPTPEVMATLFRNMHTIKGNARTYGFASITDVAHQAETTYDAIRKGDAAAWDKAKLLAELQATRDMVATYERIFKDKLAGNSADGVFVDQRLLDRLTRIIDGVNKHDAQHLRKALEDIKAVADAIGTESMESLLDGVVRSIPELAQKLGKEAPKVVIEDQNIRFVPDIAPVLKNVFTHSFRNAIDHGLEPPEERRAHGKPDQGTIRVSVCEESGKVVLSMSDDGRGLAVKKLREKAIEKGLIDQHGEISAATLAELIFHSGMSTADNVTDISGRGVGMDAIRRFIEKAGGSIEIRLEREPAANADFVPFTSRITLPSSYIKKVA